MLKEFSYNYFTLVITNIIFFTVVNALTKWLSQWRYFSSLLFGWDTFGFHLKWNWKNKWKRGEISYRNLAFFGRWVYVYFILFLHRQNTLYEWQRCARMRNLLPLFHCPPSSFSLLSFANFFFCWSVISPKIVRLNFREYLKHAHSLTITDFDSPRAYPYSRLCIWEYNASILQF